VLDNAFSPLETELCLLCDKVVTSDREFFLENGRSVRAYGEIVMPNTEQTFADRFARAQQLQAAVASFNPTFTPADASLTPAAFGTYLTDLATLNDTIAEQRADYSTQAGERAAVLAEVKSRSQRAMSYLKSNAAWARHAEAAKLIYDKLRGYRTAATPAPSVPAATVEAKKKIKSGQQSFADVEGLFTKFISALKKVPGYAPPAPELALPGLTTLAEAFTDKNDALAELAAGLAPLVKDRLARYDDLTDKAQAIKAAASAQYGPKSSEFLSIKGLKV